METTFYSNFYFSPSLSLCHYYYREGTPPSYTFNIYFLLSLSAVWLLERKYTFGNRKLFDGIIEWNALLYRSWPVRPSAVEDILAALWLSQLLLDWLTLNQRSINTATPATAEVAPPTSRQSDGLRPVCSPMRPQRRGGWRWWYVVAGQSSQYSHNDDFTSTGRVKGNFYLFFV